MMAHEFTESINQLREYGHPLSDKDVRIPPQQPVLDFRDLLPAFPENGVNRLTHGEDGLVDPLSLLLDP
jgi:hypothetical protein